MNLVENASLTPILNYFIHRRVVHYQSTGSLHSDSPSSTSVSPVPTSPSPTHTPPPPPPGGRVTPSPRTPQPTQQRPSSVVSGSGSLHKRWSSTGDFNNSGITSPTGTLIGSNSMAIASRSVVVMWQNIFLLLVKHNVKFLMLCLSWSGACSVLNLNEICGL
jgi:hypothetical protein